jgi:hypothetical protein
MLLMTTRGATSFDDLKRLKNGSIARSLEDACRERGLVKNEDEWEECMQQAQAGLSGSELISLFSLLLINNKPNNSKELFEKFFYRMASEFKQPS